MSGKYRLTLLALLAPLAAIPAEADYPLHKYRLANSCLGQLEGGVDTEERLLPILADPDSMRQGITEDRGLIAGLTVALRKIEASDSTLDPGKGTADYLIGKRAWETLKTQDIHDQFTYWKANGKISQRCQDALTDAQGYAGVLDALK